MRKEERMSDAVEALRTLRPQSIEAAADELLALKRRADAGDEGPVPLVTLHLKSGRDLTGHLLARGATGSAAGGSWLLHVPGANGASGRFASDDAAYVPAGAIEAMTVHGAGQLALVVAALAPVPSRLELSRRVAELGRALSERTHHGVAVEVDWERVPASEEMMKALAQTVELAARALAALAAEAAGREALQPVTTVRLVNDGGVVRREGPALAIPVAVGDDLSQQIRQVLA
jgi:hypothetical protein